MKNGNHKKENPNIYIYAQRYRSVRRKKNCQFVQPWWNMTWTEDIVIVISLYDNHKQLYIYSKNQKSTHYGHLHMLLDKTIQITCICHQWDFWNHWFGIFDQLLNISIKFVIQQDFILAIEQESKMQVIPRSGAPPEGNWPLSDPSESYWTRFNEGGLHYNTDARIWVFLFWVTHVAVGQKDGMLC